MKSNWKECTLGSLTSYMAKGIAPKYTEDETDHTISVLNQKCNRDFKISYNAARLNDCQKKKVPADKILQEFDVLINSTGMGTAGRVAQVISLPCKTTVDGHMIILRADKDAIDPLYFGYAVKNKFVQIESLAEGSTGQTEINRQRLNDEIIIRYPESKDMQRFIARTLRQFDDKIALNQKINENLEQQAQALFKDLFVDFNRNSQEELLQTELGLIPNDFQVFKVGELPLVVTDYVANGSFATLKANVQLYQEENFAHFIRNTDLKSDTFPVYVDEHSYNFLKKSRLFGGEIIISNVGDVGSVFLCPTLDGPMTLGNNIIMLKTEKENLRYFLYIWFKWSKGQNLIQEIKGGSAQPKFNKTDFRSLPIMIPPENMLNKFHNTVSPIFAAIDNHKQENTRLASLRDALLPKLMSGELDVSEVEV